MKTRLFELDSYKAILIFIMVASHALEMVFSHGYGDFGFCADSGFSVFVEDFMFLAGPLGFMVMMGVLISFGGKRDPARQCPWSSCERALAARLRTGDVRGHHFAPLFPCPGSWTRTRVFALLTGGRK